MIIIIKARCQLQFETIAVLQPIGRSDKLLQLSSDLILFAFTHRDKQVGHTSAKSSHFQIEDSLPFQSIMNAKELSYYKKPGKKKTFSGDKQPG